MRSDPCAIGLGCLAVAVLVTALPAATAAQARVAFRNGDQAWEWKTVEAVRGQRQKGASDVETVGGTFRIFYHDVAHGTGIGFNDPVSGGARRNTLRSVLEYLASILDVPGTADLDVLPSQTDGHGALASGGPFLVPMLGFQGGFVYEHLTTGVDPLADVADGTIVIDFGFSWNSDTDGVSAIEYDLATALLHEVSHALGIISVIGPDARSVLFNDEEAGAFTFFDAMLLRGARNAQLVLEDGAFNADSDDVSSFDLIFAGERARDLFGSFPPIFAPNPFIPGSSMGHWSLEAGDDAVMLPDLPIGIERRRYTAWELQALGDLGYDVVACGDGFVAGDEECDDANDVDLDGCSALCLLEGAAGDAGVPDAGPPDAGPPDAGPMDAGLFDAGSEPMDDLDAGDPPAARVPGEAPADDPTPFATVAPPPGEGCAVRRGNSDAAWLLLGLACLVLVRRRARYGLIS